MDKDNINLPPLIDIAVNLTDKAFEQDRAEIIHRAQAQGVNTLIITGTDLDESEQAIELTAQYPGLYSTAGIHPHYAKDAPVGFTEILKALLSQPRVCALGETGLDFNRNFSPPEVQERLFAKQLELACETGAPLLMHQRDAHTRFIEMVRYYRDDLTDGLLHCFTGNRNELYQCLDLDLHIGITGWICDERRGLGLLPLLKDIPLDRLMLETDAPYLLPRTLKPKPKSRRNEPAYLRHICEQAALHLSIDSQQLAVHTSSTARRFFRLDADQPQDRS